MMGYSSKKKKDKKRQQWEEWQRYLKQETRRVKQKSSGQVLNLKAIDSKPEPETEPEPELPEEIELKSGPVERPVGEVFEARQEPVPGVPREEALQVSDDQIGRTVKPFTYQDYKGIKPLSSPDLFDTGEDAPDDDLPEIPDEFPEDTLPESVEPLTVSSTVVTEVPEETTEQPVKKPKAGGKKKKGRRSGSAEPAEGEPGLFDSVNEHQVVSRQRLTKKSKIEREELIEKLLDPVISLEEAATLIGVCKTTVRRYTNKGELECLRTPGQQRRFKLSQVLEFVKKREADQKNRRKSKS